VITTGATRPKTSVKWPLVEKWFVRVGWSFVGVYVLTYLVLTSNGQYNDRLTVSGKRRYSFGLAIPDVRVWQPKYARLSPTGINFLGYFFSPLIYLDRWLWHQDQFPDWPVEK
jgi:hypothetical protein